MVTPEVQFLLNDTWLLMAAGLVFFMQVGFLALEAGLTRKKNSSNVAAKNIIDLGISITLFWLFGFGVMFGLSDNGGFFGTTLYRPDFLIVSQSVELFGFVYNPATFFLFQAMFCGTTVTILSGASAERMRFESYLIVSIIVSGLIYPVFGHWAWGGLLTGEPSGWLGSNGFVDFAGATVVHSIGGWSALAIVLILKPRIGRFRKDGLLRKLPHSDLPLATVGMLILWFGWFGFNGGSALLSGGSVGTIIVNTLLAGCAGLIAVIPVGIFLNRGIVEVGYLLNGALAGLVSVTASCHAISPQEALMIGFIGALIMLLFDGMLIRLQIDDAVGAIPVHLGAGIWGTFAVALYGDPAILGTGLDIWQQLEIQALGVSAAGAWAFAVTLLLLTIINVFFKLRVSREEELQGLNISEQGVLPDYSEFPGLKDLLVQGAYSLNGLDEGQTVRIQTINEPKR